MGCCYCLPCFRKHRKRLKDEDNFEEINLQNAVENKYTEMEQELEVNRNDFKNCLETKQWFFGDLTKNEAQDLLKNEEVHTFLIRKSFSKPNAPFALSVKTDNVRKPVLNFHIFEQNKHFYITSKMVFSSLDKLVEEYSRKPLTDNVMLKKPFSNYSDPSISWEVSIEDLQFGEIIGRGKFGLVHKGIWKGKIVAIKELRDINEHKTLFRKEIEVMQQIRHKNLVSLYGYNDTKHLYIISEYIKRGDLQTYLRNQGETLNQSSLFLICFQIAEGMEYLESLSIIHRDLAARNVFVDDNLQIKIGDFGMTRFLNEEQLYIMTKPSELPVRWTAPEVFLTATYSSKSDVWSFGVVLTEVFSFGQVPYCGKSNVEVVSLVKRGEKMEKPPLMPNDVYVLARECWRFEKNRRPGFKKITFFFEEYKTL